MPSGGAQASSLEWCCVWALVLLPVLRQVWLSLCSLGVVYGLRVWPYNWYHTQQCTESPPSDLPRRDDAGPKSQELCFALAAWLLKLPHTHCKAVPLASSLKCKAQWFGLCSQNFPKWTQGKSSYTDLSKKLPGGVDLFTFPQIQNSHIVHAHILCKTM